MSRGRTIIIGLDGMPYDLPDRLGRNGTMPNLGNLVCEGVFRLMASSIPEISAVAWSSIITGTNPGEHGVFGFTDIAPGTYRMTFPNRDSLRVRPFWERLDDQRAVILNVPMTYPAREINGVLVAGFVALDLERATFPRSLVPKLQVLNYQIDVDSQKAHQSLDFFLRDLERTLRARIALYRYLWHQEDWDLFMLVFTGTDRLAHFLWNAYEDRSHKHHEAFIAHFVQIDEVIGEIVQDLRMDDLLLILSDHGFERLEQNVYVNHVLAEEGFLDFEDGTAPDVRAIGSNTRAFALDPGRIYVNLKGKYPRGNIEPTDREAVLHDLEALFRSLEVEGKPVIRRVYRGEELYKGPQAYRAPDLVLLGHPGYNLSGNMKAAHPFGKDIFTGKHSQTDAFLLIRGDFELDTVLQAPTVSDVVHIIDELKRK